MGDSVKMPSVPPQKVELPKFVDSLWCVYIVSVLAAFNAEFVTYPLDLIKTRLQIQGEQSKNGKLGQAPHRGMIKTAIGISREEGLRKLWQGVHAACVRHMIYSGTRIITYKALKDNFVKQHPEQKYFPIWQSAICFIVDFISPCLTSGFTSATTIIIIIAQLKNLFGISIKSHNVLQILKEFVQKIDQIKVSDTLMGFGCIGFLVVFKYITTVIQPKNPSLKKFLWLLYISKNAITVTLATIVSVYCNQSGVPPFKITGTVPKGIPEVKFPSLTIQRGNQTIEYRDMLGDLGGGIAVVPFVAVLANIAIAKAYSINTVVDASQEMMALGLCNILGSFVRAMPSTGAFTRSAVASSSDVRTPLQGLYSGTVIVFALSFLAPYFYYIPKAVLAAVLITAVSSLLDYKILSVLWKCNKVDFFLTLGTFVIGTFFGVEAALVLGSILNLLILVKLWSRPKINTDVKEIRETQVKYLYLKPELGLYYPGADYLAECIKKNRSDYPTLPIVLDCSNFLRLDYSAAKTLINILRTFNYTKTIFVMINVEENILNIMKTIPNSKSLLRFCNKTISISEIIAVNVEEEEDLLLKLNDDGDIKSIERSIEVFQMLENENSRRSSKCSLGTTSTRSPISENSRKFSVYS
ncbi:sodium-independent sulfate anion transporter-like isoform X3 [Diabrotica undecimpunctata]|uniref:sodium-independent sulfate anion transporter-like isoform X3 n=1 Tax=Diabrotica undecimpunctata TaxID=50387 RepID=UPI003B63E5C0